MTTSHRPRPATRKAPRSPRSYTPLSDALAQPLVFADTELSEGIQRHSLVGLLRAALSRKRRADGEPLPNVLCALLTWPLLQVKSLHCFCAQLCQFLAGQVSVLYDFLGREDINWRGLSSQLAWQVQRANDLGPRSHRAFVVDDTSQARAGRKVEGTSCYFDHTEGRHRKGHQVLQLGLAAEKGFLPLEAQIVTGQKAAVDKCVFRTYSDGDFGVGRTVISEINSDSDFGPNRTGVSANSRTVLVRSELGVRNGPKGPRRSGVALDNVPEGWRLTTRHQQWHENLSPCVTSKRSSDSNMNTGCRCVRSPAVVVCPRAPSAIT